MRKYHAWVLVALAAVCLYSVGLFAKYYAQSAKPGIAVATGVYFTSNYAASGTDFTESLIRKEFTSGSCSFTLQVRNYENNLLFNDTNISIPYTMSLWTEDAHTNAEYKVAYLLGEESKSFPIGTKESKTVIQNRQIEGGAPMAHNYEITITDHNDMKSAVPIYVEITTESGALIQKTLTGKITLEGTQEVKDFISSSSFVVPNETSDMKDPQKIEAIAREVSLTYEIRTVGQVLTSDEVTQELILAWNSDKLDIDRFNGNYLAWLAEDPTRTGPESYTGTDVQGNPLPAGSNWQYITLKAMPYSTEDTIFYNKGIDFKDGTLTMDSLNGYVIAKEKKADNP
ncbi:MAG: hypothetical protein PHE02_06075 [Lachnospiraceae bacterium]|nr:hypothetical protein [Lachnospiraceae bacterium]